MRLSLYPCSGTGRQWRLSLDLGDPDGLDCLSLEADLGERTYDGRPDRRGGRLQVDELTGSLVQARSVAAQLGLHAEVEHDDSHWTWTR